MKTIRTFVFLCLLISLSACTSSSSNSGGVKEGELFTLDVNNLSNEVHTVYFSELMESVEFFQLDTVPEAFTSIPSLSISENYFLVIGTRTPCKLFRRSDGKYLNDISRRGQGPGEYWLINGGIIDEQRESIYLIDSQRDYLMAYDMNGKYMEEDNIPLPGYIQWGKIYLNKDNALVFTTPADAGTNKILGNFVETLADKHLCWVQDLKGNVLKSTPSDRVIMSIEKRHSNVLYVSRLSPESPIYTYTIHQRDVYQGDTLYHYNAEKNLFYPAYTTNLTHNSYTLIASVESPLHYYTTHQIYKEGQINSGGNLKKCRMIQVDKKTGKARYIRIVNDLISGDEVVPYFFQTWITDNGLVITYSNDPLELKEGLEKVLKTNTKMEASLRERLTKLKDSLHEESNNVIFIYKFKKE